MALPVEILFGLYLGLLVGVLPALVAWSLGFVVRYFTGVTVPGFAVVVLGLAIAGVNGGFLGLLDAPIRNSPRLVTATLIVVMMTLYAHNRGDLMGATFPHRVTLRSLRERSLSADVVELVGGRGRVRVYVAGEVADVEGYPSLPADLRATIREGSWTFPADLPLSELEARLADRLRTEHDLAAVTVEIDERARATVGAAPPAGELSRRVPDGHRAVSVDALLPTGVARGDVVTLRTPSVAVEGTVVSARTYGSDGRSNPSPVDAVRGGDPELGDGREPDDGRTAGSGTVAADGEPAAAAPVHAAPTTDGGEGRLTVTASPDDAERLLGVDRARAVVRSRGTRREYELVSLLRGAGTQFRRLTVRDGGVLADATLREAGVLDSDDVAVLGVRHAPGRGGRSDRAEQGGHRWLVAPDGDTRLAAGDELLAVGTPAALDRLREVAT